MIYDFLSIRECFNIYIFLYTRINICTYIFMFVFTLYILIYQNHNSASKTKEKRKKKLTPPLQIGQHFTSQFNTFLSHIMHIF